jgi:hypothetical protein
MPKVIPLTETSVTYSENPKVMEWMNTMAHDRNADVSVIIREATSAYYLEHKEIPAEPTHFDQRAAAKAHKRLETARQIASGEISPTEAQERNAPIHSTVHVRNLWPAIRRYVRGSATKA